MIVLGKPKRRKRKISESSSESSTSEFSDSDPEDPSYRPEPKRRRGKLPKIARRGSAPPKIGRFSSPKSYPVAPPVIQPQVVEPASMPTDVLLTELLGRDHNHACVCGLIFTDTTMHYLHKTCHDGKNPLKCIHCQTEQNSYLDFLAHMNNHEAPADV